jgi:hypothetical protein
MGFAAFDHSRRHQNDTMNARWSKATSTQQFAFVASRD